MIAPVFAKSFEEMVCDRYQRSEWRSRCYGGGGGGLGGGGYGGGESSAIRDGGSSRGLQASADSELAAARDRRSAIGDRRQRPRSRSESSSSSWWRRRPRRRSFKVFDIAAAGQFQGGFKFVLPARSESLGLLLRLAAGPHTIIVKTTWLYSVSLSYKGPTSR
jgi:hypothetical protein